MQTNLSISSANQYKLILGWLILPLHTNNKFRNGKHISIIAFGNFNHYRKSKQPRIETMNATNPD
jgi:hypothetical protein